MDEVRLEQLKESLQSNIRALQEERDEWSEKVSPIYAMLNDVHRYADIQVMMLSYRHVFIDRIAMYRSKYNNTSTKISNNKAQLFESYIKKYKEFHTNFSDRDVMVNGHPVINPYNAYMDELKLQIDFFQGYVDMMDKVGYAMKLKADLQKNYIV